MLIYLLTWNEYKLKIANSVFLWTDFIIEKIKLDIPEIQWTNEQIAKFQSEEALKILNWIVIREDHGLFFDWLNWFPWEYVSHMEKKIWARELLKLINSLWWNLNWYFKVATSVSYYNKWIIKTKVFVNKIPIKLSKELRWNRKNMDSWDLILMMKNSCKTFAECNNGENMKYWKYNYIEVLSYLKKIYL